MLRKSSSRCHHHHKNHKLLIIPMNPQLSLIVVLTMQLTKYLFNRSSTGDIENYIILKLKKQASFIVLALACRIEE